MKHKQQRMQAAIKAKRVMRKITHQISSVGGGEKGELDSVMPI